MNKISFPAFEERLYLRAGDTTGILRYRRSALVSGILFSLLFAGAWFALRTDGVQVLPEPVLETVLALYAVMTCLAVMNFSRPLEAYRSILRKIGRRLAERTGTALPPEAEDEPGDRRNLLILTGFYLAVLAALMLRVLPGFVILPATVLFLLLTALLKCRAADRILEAKKACVETGTKLRELTWPDGGK